MTVSEILERRLAVSDAPKGLGPAASALVHVGFLVLLVLLSRPQRIAVLPIALPVRVVSPSSLPGRPAAVKAPVPVPTAPPEPAPAPEAARKKPVIEKLNQPEKIVPSKSAMPEPTTKRQKWLEPTPVPASGAPSVELPAAGSGGAEGTAGALSFGTSVASFDVDFPFAFYVDQMLQLIGANWLKPDVPDGHGHDRRLPDPARREDLRRQDHLGLGDRRLRPRRRPVRLRGQSPSAAPARVPGREPRHPSPLPLNDRSLPRRTR